MNTTQLKSFASEARLSLLSGVKSKMNALGFKENGRVDERDYPIQAPDGTFFQNEIYDVSFYGKWMRLHDEINRCGFRQVCEEGAYTWFNRLMAIHILAKNGLINPVLEFESQDVRIPLLVKQAHDGIRPDMSTFDTQRLDAVIDDDNRITDQFAILIVAYCQSTPILYKCFGTLNDFTELLLPTNILASNGFLSLLNTSSFITEEDYKTTELIGWLYQFYISDRKDEVFASFKKGKKAKAEDIPAATQIFTPNWVVKYMVQNTLGRIYLDNNPDSQLKEKWQYLVEPAESDAEKRSRLEVTNLEDLTIADLSCGSGHILGEAFDMLIDIYKEEGFARRKAIECIFSCNLVGVDIDTRAKQLATFALMLKACQQWPDAINCEVMPRVLDMPSPNDPICERYPILRQANNLGSIMKIEALPGETHPLVLALTQKYAAIVMNPPYMGGSNMNNELAKYVKDKYKDEKADLFAVFMKVAEEHLLPNAKYGMINMQSWMFLKSFEKLRKHVVKDLQIDNMLHLGPHTFDELGGEVVQNTAYVITNAKPSVSGYYFRLVDFTPSDLKKDNFLNCCRAIRCNGGISKMEIDISPYCFNVNQSIFNKIPGFSIGFWASKSLLDVFSNKKLGEICPVKKGADTANNNYFLRYWHEVNYRKLGIRQNSSQQFTEKGFKWAPYNKGGHSRKWYGNNDVFVLWENNGYELEHSNGNLRSKQLYFKDSITWNALTTSAVTARYSDYGAIFDSAGSSMFPDSEKIFYLLAFMNTKCVDAVLRILNPTLNYGAGTVSTIPSKLSLSEDIDNTTKECIRISKQDWDAHETSWDFKENELICVFKEGKASDLKSAVKVYEDEWDEKFEQLRNNEEELNRLFIEIYGLQNELSQEVPEDEVTILQQGEIDFIPAPGSDGLMSHRWLNDNIIQQFISYAIGCYMGRYRLDRSGLHIAHPNPTTEELAPYQVSQGESFSIDEDGIIPLMSPDSGFADCAATRVSQFVKLVFGEENHAANMNFLQDALGKDVESYLAKDFYKDHKKRYQNCPIYWLFSSKKGAFKVLVYMHRMTPYTVERIRSKYLLPYIERLTERINDLNASILKLTSAQAKELQKMEKALQECREYHDLLHPVANQNIAIDLDDGVAVNYAKFGKVLAKLK